jgi:hypothetical protein
MQPHRHSSADSSANSRNTDEDIRTDSFVIDRVGGLSGAFPGFFCLSPSPRRNCEFCHGRRVLSCWRRTTELRIRRYTAQYQVPTAMPVERGCRASYEVRGTYDLQNPSVGASAQHRCRRIFAPAAQPFVRTSEGLRPHAARIQPSLGSASHVHIPRPRRHLQA